MQVKKFMAVVMSLCMAASAVSYGTPIITKNITAQAASIDCSCYSFDETTGVLTLRGEVDRDTLKEFGYYNDVKVISVTAEEGTVLPNNSSSLFYYYNNCTSIDLSKADASSVTDMSSIFAECSALKKIAVRDLDTSKVTNMADMFSGCKNLSSIDLSGFDTRNVTDMSGMFYGCTNLSSLDLRSFDTSKVTDMSAMFLNCKKLTALDVSGFDTGNVTNMGSMFYCCSGISRLDLSRFNTSNVTLMYSMFNGCSALTKLDISGFDTRKVTEMYTMFGGCTALTSLDLSSFDTSEVIYMNDMFTLCDGLNTITLGKNFKNIAQNTYLPNGDGWVNVNAPKTIISGNGKYAVIENSGKNTYKRFGTDTGNSDSTNTYPTNIKVEYSETYHQVRFTWNKVEGADRYGIAVYLAGKWRIQTQNITGTVYTSPKNLTTGKTYKIAVAARVNGSWDTTNPIKNAVTVTVK